MANKPGEPVSAVRGRELRFSTPADASQVVAVDVFAEPAALSLAGFLVEAPVDAAVISGTPPDVIRVYRGDLALSHALATGRLQAHGMAWARRLLSRWFVPSRFAHIWCQVTGKAPAPGLRAT